MNGSFHKSSELSQYATGPDLGNSQLEGLLKILIGQSYAPRPQGNQSVYDAYLSKSRSQDFMRMMGGNSFTGNQVFSRLGINPNAGLLRGPLGMQLGDPDGLFMQSIAPFIGGNPVKAQMQNYAMHTGNTMGAFGSFDNITLRQSDAMMKGAMNSFYQHKETVVDLDKKAKARFKELDGVIQKPEYSNARKLLGMGTSTQDHAASEDKMQQSRKNIGDATKELRDLDEEIGGIYSSVNQDKKYTTPEEKKREISRRVKEKREQYAKIVKKVYAGDEASYQKILDAFDKNTETHQAGDTSKLQEGISTASTTLNELSETQKGIGKGRKTSQISNIDYKKSRGFKIEDFVSGMAVANDVGLTADKRKATTSAMQEAQQSFSDNSGGALSAARSIWGKDKTGGDLVKEISNLYGRSGVDLSSAQGSKEAEKMLRDMKATARMAGVSIDAVLGIVKEGERLAQSHPELRYLSGKTNLDITMKAINSVQAFNVTQNAGAIRAQGGTQQITKDMQQEQLQATGSDISRRVAALSNRFKGDPKAKALLEKFASGPVNEGAYSQLLSNLSKVTGRGVMDLGRVADDKGLQEAGLSDKEDSALGTKSANQAILTQFRQQFSPEMLNKYLKANKGNVQQALKYLVADHGNDNAKAIYQQYGKTINSLMDQEANPEVYAEQKRKQEQMVKEDTEMDRRLGFLNATPLQQVAQDVLSGKFSEDAAASLKGAFMDQAPSNMTPEEEKAYEEKATEKVKMYETHAKSLKDAQTEFNASGKTSEDAKKLREKQKDVGTILLQQKYGKEYEEGMGGLSGSERSGMLTDLDKDLRSFKNFDDLEAQAANWKAVGEDPTKKNTPEGRAALAKYNTYKLMGVNKENFGFFQQQGAGALVGQEMQKELKALGVQAFEDTSKERINAVTSDLDKVEGGSDLKNAFTKNGKFDVSAFADAYNNKDEKSAKAKWQELKGKGYKGSFEDYKKSLKGAQESDAIDKNMSTLTKGLDSLNEFGKKSDGANAAADPTKMLENIYNAINSGALTTVIGNLASALGPGVQ